MAPFTGRYAAFLARKGQGEGPRTHSPPREGPFPLPSEQEWEDPVRFAETDPLRVWRTVT
jgi:hypothetical protein